MISNIIEEIKKYFGDFSVVRGDKHTFLGMNIEIKNNIIHIDKVKNMRELRKFFEKYVSTPVLSPATKHIEVSEDEKQLSYKKVYLFHSVVEE